MNQKIGSFEFISYNYLLAGVKAKCGIRNSTIDDLNILDWLNEGLKELRLTTGTGVQIVTELPIVDFKVKLPDGFIRFTKRNPIAYVNAAGKIVDGVQGDPVVYVTGNGFIRGGNPYAPVGSNNAFYENNPYGNWVLGGTAQVVNGYIFFSTNITAQYVKIAYWGANIDHNTGEIVVPAYCERALVAYAIDIWATANQRPELVQKYRSEWINGKRQCKALANMPDSLEFDVIAYNMLALS